jgi:hypothetical protein
MRVYHVFPHSWNDCNHLWGQARLLTGTSRNCSGLKKVFDVLCYLCDISDFLLISCEKIQFSTLLYMCRKKQQSFLLSKNHEHWSVRPVMHLLQLFHRYSLRFSKYLLREIDIDVCFLLLAQETIETFCI